MSVIYKRQGSKNYWMSYRDASGKTVRRSSGTPDKTEAQRRLAAAEAAAKAVTENKAAEDLYEALLARKRPGRPRTEYPPVTDAAIEDLVIELRRALDQLDRHEREMQRGFVQIERLAEFIRQVDRLVGRMGEKLDDVTNRLADLALGSS